MKISYDPAKHAPTLAERGVDFDDAAVVFDGAVFTFEDTRLAYPEPRFVSFGLLADRLVAIVWTPVEDARRIISMRKANDREQTRYRQRFGENGFSPDPAGRI